jgi:hypothetical protein
MELLLIRRFLFSGDPNRGFVKTYFVTLFTLAVGFWSVIKGTGVTFSVETALPTR